MPIFIEKIFNFSFFRIILDRNAQHDIELAKFQQTIKEQALTILNVNKELKSCQQKIESMKQSEEDMHQLEVEIEKKADQIKLLNDQSKNKTHGFFG
jgi:hypothetical protein